MMTQYLTITLFILFIAFINAQKETGGTNAPRGKYLYQAALRKKSKFICGASIISENWLLTAAHCAKDIEIPTDGTIVVGTVKVNGEDGIKYKIQKLIEHERYNKGFRHAHDIALVLVWDKIIFNDKVQPVKLPRENSNTYENIKAVLAGWGTGSNNTIPSSILQHVQLRVINLVECAKKWEQKRKRTILKTHLCTSGLHEQNLVTHGDSGSPLVVNNMQIGILSFAWKDLPDVFTRVASYVPWIERHVV